MNANLKANLSLHLLAARPGPTLFSDHCEPMANRAITDASV